jgi:hypothetical protein
MIEILHKVDLRNDIELQKSLVERMIKIGLIRPADPPPPKPQKKHVAPPRDPSGHRFAQKLSDAQVIEIRRRWNTSERLHDIAKDFGISFAYVTMIGTGRRRRKVKE